MGIDPRLYDLPGMTYYQESIWYLVLMFYECSLSLLPVDHQPKFHLGLHRVGLLFCLAGGGGGMGCIQPTCGHRFYYSMGLG